MSARFVVRQGLVRGKGLYLAIGADGFTWTPNAAAAFRFTERGLAEAVAFGYGARVIALKPATKAASHAGRKTPRRSSLGVRRASRRAA